MRSTWILLLLATPLLSGCTQDAPEASEPETATNLQGFVLDELLRPVPNATLTWLGNGTEMPVHADGSFATLVVPGEVLLEATAPGHLPQTRQVHIPEQGNAEVTFYLTKASNTAPWTQVLPYQGTIECSFFATVGHSHGSGGRPQGENPTDCGTTTGQTRSTWQHEINAGADGLVIEIYWESDSQLSEQLIMIVDAVGPEGELEFLSFQEGTSPLKAHIPSIIVQDLFATGGTLQVDVQIGGDPNADATAGMAIDQGFQAYTSVFFGHTPGVHYTIG